MRLYLHADLCKAEAPTEYGPTKRARGVPSPEMRLKPTTHKKTGGMARRTQRMERDYAGEVHNKPAYRCKDCGNHVLPPKKEKVEGSLDPERYADHVKAGRDVRLHDKGATIYHRPKMAKQGKVRSLEHGAVTPEMLPTKNVHGKKIKGTCPECHDKPKSKEIGRGTGATPEKATARAEYQALTKKSVELLDDLLGGDKEPVRKSVPLFLTV